LGIDPELDQWLTLSGSRAELRQGYRDGFFGQSPVVMSLVKLARGEPYPLPLKHGEGASAQFLTKSGNIRQIVLPGMDSKEQAALMQGMIKPVFLYDSGAMLFLFSFMCWCRQTTHNLESPFDIRLLSPTKRNLQSIDNPEQRLTIEIHAVDENKILRAWRLVTMPPDMTIAFLSAVQEQLAAIDKPGVMERWMQQNRTN